MSKGNQPVAVPKSRRLRRKLAIAVVVILLVLVGGWFVVTSAAFLKSVVLPRVGASLNADVSVSDATIRPFKQIVLYDFKLQAHGEEAFFTATEIRCRYSLFDLLGGAIAVEELTLKSPRIHYIQKPDGTSNLDPLLESMSGKSSAAAPASPPSAGPMQLDIRQVSIEDAAILYAATDSAGIRTSVELDDISILLKDLRNGGEGTLEFATTFKANLASATTNALLQAGIAGNFNVNLASDATPIFVQGKTALTVTDARGALAPLAAFAADFDCRVSEGAVEHLTLTTRKAAEDLAKVRVSGPFDAAKGEGRLTIELFGMDRRFLNLAGAPFGLGFGNTAVTSTNTLELREHGAELGVVGQLLVTDFAVAVEGSVSPPVRVSSDYRFTVRAADQTFALQTLQLEVMQMQKPILKGQVSSPLSINWSRGIQGLGDADLTFNLTNLDLGEFRAFTGTNLLGGVVQGSLALKSTQGGETLSVRLSGQGDEFRFLSGGELLSNIGFTLQSAVSIEKDDQIRINEAEFTLTHSGRSALAAQMGGIVNLKSPSTTLIAGVVAHLDELNAFLPESSRSLPNETLKVQMSLDAAMTNRVATLQQAVISLGPTDRARNEVTLTGVVDLADTNAISGHLKLAAESLDVTRYYELFEQMGSTSNNFEAPPTPSPAETEPEEMRFPVRNFMSELSIQHLYLREMDIADWRASLRIDGARVLLDPCDLKLNGASVTAMADLDLGVPGWKYQIAGGLEAVPMAPLVNSFVPDRKGQFSGTANAEVRIQAAGRTGHSLQKNLAGQFDLGATNLNFTLDNARSKLVRKLSNVLLTLPDLARNPTGAGVGKLIGAIMGGSRSTDTGEWSKQVKASPVDSLNLRGSVGNGTVHIEEALAQSPAFLARASGEMTLMPVLTNSMLKFPVGLSLSRSLAEKSGLLPINTPTNAAYVKLPDFLTLEGSLGDPKSKINYLALAQLVSQSGANLTSGSGNQDLDRASGILGAVGNLLGGKAPPGTNAPAEDASTNTPSPSTNKFLDLFK